MRNLLIFSIGILVVFFALIASPVLAQNDLAATVAQIKKDLAQLKAGQAETNGKAVYRIACAGCHGINGDGRAPSAQGFEFRATNFGRAVYKFRSTKFDALPTDEDLERSIRQGVPGTEMVPFGDLLTPLEIHDIAQYIKTFANSFNGPAAGEIVPLPAKRPFPRSEESIAAGQEIFKRETCDTCHGARGDGHGKDSVGMTDGENYPMSMFDWSRGVYKSGTTDRDLFRTITTGMNGTPMEAYSKDVTEKERWELVDFIHSLKRQRTGFGGFMDYLLVDDPSGMNYARPQTRAAR